MVIIKNALSFKSISSGLNMISKVKFHLFQSVLETPVLTVAKANTVK